MTYEKVENVTLTLTIEEVLDLVAKLRPEFNLPGLDVTSVRLSDTPAPKGRTLEINFHRHENVNE